jgi:hypothetical protein
MSNNNSDNSNQYLEAYEKLYERHVTFLKWAAGIAGAGIIAAAGFLTWFTSSTYSQFKADALSDVKLMREDVGQIRAEASTAISNVQDKTTDRIAVKRT